MTQKEMNRTLVSRYGVNYKMKMDDLMDNHWFVLDRTTGMILTSFWEKEPGNFEEI